VLPSPAGTAKGFALPESLGGAPGDSLWDASLPGRIAQAARVANPLGALGRDLAALYAIPEAAVSTALRVPGGGAPDVGGGAAPGFGPVGLASTSMASRVVNGADVVTDYRGQMPYPWYAQLRVHRRGTSFGICGGSIVHAWPADAASRRPAGVWVVTAAHCLTGLGSLGGAGTQDVYAVNLYVGGQRAYSTVTSVGAFAAPAPASQEATPNGDGAWLEVPPSRVAVFTHPLYDPATNHFDVALLRVLLPEGLQLPATVFDADAGAVRWEHVARLPVSEAPPRDAAVIGFGATSPGGAASHELQYGAVRVEDPAVRQRITAHPSYTPLLNTWATGPTNAAGEAVDTCQGDSGGPLFAFEREFSEAPQGQMAAGAAREVHTVHAVTSWGISCGVPTYPGVYAKLAPHVAPAAGAVASKMPPASPWRLGLVGMIDALSPTGLGYRRASGAVISLPPAVSEVPPSGGEERTSNGPAGMGKVGLAGAAAGGVIVLALGLAAVRAAGRTPNP
jgi:hypothetical protein